MIEVTASIVKGREWVARAMKATMGQQGPSKPISDKTLRHLLVAKHSPIKEYRFWFDIVAPERVHTHCVRHSNIGIFVATSRPDIEYHKPLEDGMRRFSMEIDAKRLIEIMQIRLCGRSWEDTRLLFYKMKRAVIELDPVFETVLFPTCVWYGFCPEARENNPSCGYSAMKANRELLMGGL